MFTYREVSIYEAEINQELLEEDTRDIQLEFDLENSMFVVVCLIKLLPEMNLSIWLWIWIAVIAVIKIFNIIAGFIYKKKLIAEHTIMNKITGFLLFCYPLTIFLIEINYSAILICTIATFAAVQEGYIVCKSC